MPQGTSVSIGELLSFVIGDKPSILGISTVLHFCICNVFYFGNRSHLLQSFLKLSFEFLWVNPSHMVFINCRVMAVPEIL